MPGHRWTRPICHAWAKSRGRPCRRPVGLRRDRTFHVGCWSHGSNTPPYSERPISAAGKARISAAARAMWERFSARAFQRSVMLLTSSPRSPPFSGRDPVDHGPPHPIGVPESPRSNATSRISLRKSLSLAASSRAHVFGSSLLGNT
jgi:hypothetical protein